MTKMKSVLISESTDPFVNLAWERSMLDDFPEDCISLLLYVNRPSVVMGRYQNALQECNAELLRERKLALLRRYSGGGTVYHDAGNLNFCFIGPRDGFDKADNTRFIADTLSAFGPGLRPEISGRGDLFLDGKKFSGNAFKYSGRGVLHHGTLLIDADLDLLEQVLAVRLPDDSGAGLIDSKAVQSVRSQVCNFSDFFPGADPEDLKRRLASAFSAEMPETVDDTVLSRPGVRKYYDELKSLEWLWGNAPAFRVSSSDGSAALAVEKGMVRIFSAADGEKPMAALFPLDRGGLDLLAGASNGNGELLRLVAWLQLFFPDKQ